MGCPLVGLLPSFLQARGLVKQHIESFDYFLDNELRSIMEANKEVRCDVSRQLHAHVDVAAPHAARSCSRRSSSSSRRCAASSR